MTDFLGLGWACSLPRYTAIIVLILNIILPGSGLFLMGISVPVWMRKSQKNVTTAKMLLVSLLYIISGISFVILSVYLLSMCAYSEDWEYCGLAYLCPLWMSFLICGICRLHCKEVYQLDRESPVTDENECHSTNRTATDDSSCDTLQNLRKILNANTDNNEQMQKLLIVN